MDKSAFGKYVTPAEKRSVNRRNIQKMDKKDDAFHDWRRTDADTSAVEEEMSRASENARNGCVKSEDVMKENDEEDEQIWPKWLKRVLVMGTDDAQFGGVTLKRT